MKELKYSFRLGHLVLCFNLHGVRTSSKWAWHRKMGVAPKLSRRAVRAFPTSHPPSPVLKLVYTPVNPCTHIHGCNYAHTQAGLFASMHSTQLYQVHTLCAHAFSLCVLNSLDTCCPELLTFSMSPAIISS